MKRSRRQMLPLLACLLIIAELTGLCVSFQPQSAFISNRKIRSGDSRVLKRRFGLRLSTEGIVDENDDTSRDELQRRKFFQQCCAIVTAPLLVPRSSNAMGLVQFPCTTPLLNTYHVMRAGQNLLEEEDIISTNPLFLTNREAALSPTGIAQVQEACKILELNQINPSVVKYSLAASAMDTTAIVKEALKVGQNRIIPEFTFMDPRGIGKWDMMSYAQTLPAIYALDETEAGKDGKFGRPPPNDDGTPNETLAEQSVRLRQLMSVLETQFQGDSVLLIFPDGSTPALLSCMIAGIPFNKVHELEFAPGEVRLDLTMTSVQKYYEARQQQLASNGEYEKKLQLGKVELERLRGLDPATIVSKKDLKIEREAAEIEEQQRKKEEQQRLKREKEEEARLLRQKQIQAAKEREAQARILRANAQSPGEGDKTTQIAMGGVASLAVAAALATGKSNPDPVAVSSGSMALRNETSSNIGTMRQNATIAENQPLASSAASEMTLPGTQPETTGMPGALPQATLPFGDIPPKRSLYSDPVPTMEERKQAADEAMQEYLDKDDGGEDWLTVMGQLIEEDDDDIELDTEEGWQ